MTAMSFLGGKSMTCTHAIMGWPEVYPSSMNRDREQDARVVLGDHSYGSLPGFAAGYSDRVIQMLHSRPGASAGAV